MVRPAKTKQSATRRVPVSRLPWKLTSTSRQYTTRLGRVIGRVLRGGETIALYGPLGAGKTALVRGIAQGLGAPPTAVTSPTFVVIHEYQGRLPLAHVDLYRIGSLRELESTGLTEYFSGQTVTAIEWADRGLASLPQDRIEITLSHRAAQTRMIQLSVTGPKSHEVLTLVHEQYSLTDRVRRTATGPSTQ
ncbi:MAG: tRNA (adenosine(37)-N6)-threonylcarbamoyltransferase complex ATPase subunit type 1 TsaE [Nitrospiraceae bacterium]|nr:tRNA (adenosine(37)-N6)-threonylcarbamoyltransferase complex ATPase subunit type 1 TsaE [Nitrospiraceae bacterium]